MCGRRLASLAMLLLLGALSGCASARQHALAAAEPPLEPQLHDGEPVVVGQTQPPSQSRAVTFADRHPLFTKPREYYQNSGDNKLVKSAAATLIGVPAGVLGEMRQIVVGQPRNQPY